MENILQLNSNTFFIDRKSNDYSIIENFLLKKASEYNVKDVEEIEIVLSSDYNCDIDFKTREGSVRIKEAILGTALKTLVPVGIDIVKGLVIGNHTPGSSVYDKVAGNPIGGFLGKHPMMTGLMGVLPGLLTGDPTSAIAGFLGGSYGGGLGAIATPLLMAAGLSGLPLILAMGAMVLTNQTLGERSNELPAEKRQIYMSLIDSEHSNDEAMAISGYRPTAEEIRELNDKKNLKYQQEKLVKNQPGMLIEDLNTKLTDQQKKKLEDLRRQGLPEDFINTEREKMVKEVNNLTPSAIKLGPTEERFLQQMKERGMPPEAIEAQKNKFTSERQIKQDKYFAKKMKSLGFSPTGEKIEKKPRTYTKKKPNKSITTTNPNYKINYNY